MKLKIALIAVLTMVLSAPVFADGFYLSIGGPQYEQRHDWQRHDRGHDKRYDRDDWRHGKPGPVIQIGWRNDRCEPAGRWETVTRQEWVPGYYEKVWVPEKREVIQHRGYVDHCGRYHPGWTEVRVICPAHYENRWHEGYYRTWTERVWVRY